MGLAMAGGESSAQLPNDSAGGSGDFDGNGWITLKDFVHWPVCMTGPHGQPPLDDCRAFDFVVAGTIDLRDAAAFQRTFDRLLNDSCATPTAIGDGFTDFNNTGATTDGPTEPETCDFFGSAQIFSDLWFCYEASCSGEVVMSLCGSRYDSKMAVYSGCGCPVSLPLACSDDDCSVGTTDSRVTLSVAAGRSYLIRVGGVPGPLGEQGLGTLTVRCGVEACSDGAGDCSLANGSGGCEDIDCCRTVCRVDAFCCDVTWDGYCAGFASGLCFGGFDSCGPGAGGCSIDNDTPGCDDVDCCNAVCRVDPFCCTTRWDGFCADRVSELCP